MWFGHAVVALGSLMVAEVIWAHIGFAATSWQICSRVRGELWHRAHVHLVFSIGPFASVEVVPALLAPVYLCFVMCMAEEALQLVQIFGLNL